jgi:hypothetical protein
MPKSKLTTALLCQEAAGFAQVESTYPEPTLYGVTDGKAIGRSILIVGWRKNR